MQQVNFRFGDYIQREGEVPKGMYLIKSGQCTVGKVVTASRKFNLQETQGWRRMIKDPNPLFNNFNYDNSLFNKQKLHSKAVQNCRIYINQKGEQVKNEVLYENIVSCRFLVDL